MSDNSANTGRPRLILLTQWFDPEPTMKGLAFARRLQERGFDVEVVTGFPNYPGGKVYDGYRIRPILKEHMEGIAVTRLALYPSHDRSRIGRVLNYVSFLLSATLYLVFFARRADVLYVYHPPLTVALAAVIARGLRRIPMVLDIQDMWPDTLRATGMIGNERVLGVIGAVSRWTWRRADRISVLSPGFRRLLVERGVPEARIAVIPNWADETAAAVSPLAAGAPSVLGEAGRFRLLFAGNMGPAQALDSVLDAAAITAARREDIEFCFLGSGIETERLKARAAAEKLGNVRFLPRVSMAEVGAFLAAADALLVHLKADPLFAITIPSKTQAYMAAGKPVLMAVEGDAADLVRQSGGGVVVPPEDAPALAGAVIALADLPVAERAAMGADARGFYDGNLSFERGVETTAALLRAVLPEKRQTGLTVGKRLFDILGAAAGLVLLSPLLLAVAIMLRRRMGSPVLFRQTRPGLHGRPFEMIKFRSMTDARSADGALLSNAERLTPFGRFLRATSLDELPELWNVLKGEMSLVGPRPLLMDYLPLYSPEQARRHDVRPGITGWAQVNGRNAIGWEEKFALDVWYVDNRSFRLDLKIVWMTVMKVARRDGISAAGDATMPKFTGSAQ